MKKLMWLVVFSLSGQLGAQTGMGFGGYGAYSGQGPEQQLEQIQSVLDLVNQAKNQLKNPASEDVQPCDSTGLCSFRDVCLALQKNRNSRVLYRNAAGEELVNYHFLRAESQMNFCLNSQLSMKASIESGIEAQKKMTQTFTDSYKKYIDSQKALNRAVVANGDSEKFLKVQTAMFDIQMAGFSPAVASPEDYIEQAQKKAGVRLSAKTLAAWKQSLSGMSYSNYGYGMGMASDMKPLPMESTGDPFFEPELLENAVFAGGPEKQKQYQGQYQKRLAEVERYFQETQQATIEVLKSKRNPQNAERIDRMIERVSQVKFKIAGRDGSTCASPNAYYSHSDHTVYLCPNKMKNPRGALLSVLGHELGHSIDPCCMAKDLHKDSNKYSIQFAEVSKSKADSLGIAFDDHPFKSAVECIQSPQKSIGATLVSPELRQKQQRAFFEAIHGAGGPPIESEANESEQYRKYAACNVTVGADKTPSQIQEAYSDWMSAEVLAHIVRKEPSVGKQKELVREATMSMATTGCFDVEPEISDETIQSLTKMGCPVASPLDRQVGGLEPDRTHPPTFKRVNHILLAHPQLASAAECAPTSGKVRCE